VTVTRPDLYRDYLIEQLSLLQQDFDIQLEVGRSNQEIPFPYVLDPADLAMADVSSVEIARHFPTTELAYIGDEIADGGWIGLEDEPRPLALFDGLRTDFSLARLSHYSGTPAEHCQQFILFTNYHRYVDEFVSWGCEQLRAGGPYTALSAAGHVYVTADSENPEAAIAAGTWRKHQMPAYHLMAPGRAGITLVNIGVGPPTPRPICDHLAVMRPQAWLMIGHCGGLRGSQKIGDYVLGPRLPARRPRAGQGAAAGDPDPAAGRGAGGAEHRRGDHHRRDGDVLKRRLRTGTGLLDRRPQLGAQVLVQRAAVQPEPRRRHRHGERHHRRPGLPLPGAVRDAAVRVGQAAARRDQAAGPGQRLLRPRHRPSTCRSAWRRSTCCARKARACTRANCAASTSRRSGEGEPPPSSMGEGDHEVVEGALPPAGWTDIVAARSPDACARPQRPLHHFVVPLPRERGRFRAADGLK
jgi:hypothetical protein